MDNKLKFRVYLFGISFCLPFITGLAAAFLKLKNDWNGQQESFSETFFNYAIPIPVAAGCIQIFLWPATFGILIALSFIKNNSIFLASIFLFYIIWVIITVLNPSIVNLVFILPDIILPLLCVIVTKPFKTETKDLT